MTAFFTYVTLIHFFITAIILLYILKIIVLSKDIVQLILNTTIPPLRTDNNDKNIEKKKNIDRSRSHAFWFISIGILLAIFFSLSGLYRQGLTETYIVEYPDVSYLTPIFSFMANQPLIKHSTFVGDLLQVSHPIQKIIVFCVLGPLVLGLWNYTYLFENMSHFTSINREDILEKSIYYPIAVILGQVPIVFVLITVTDI